jgi:predicted nucleic acid-binding protein
MTPVFLDANVFLYSTGRTHPLKEPCLGVLRLVARHRDRFVTDVEVFQEILHRSLSIRRWEAIRLHFDAFMALMAGSIEPIIPADVERTARLIDRLPRVIMRYPAVAARDLLHVAVMQRIKVARIVTADKGFGEIEGIERLDPMLVDEWVHLVTGQA